jgi:peptidyl-prolyl cis-trans isomerase B (cyclophilin B)
MRIFRRRTTVALVVCALLGVSACASHGGQAERDPGASANVPAGGCAWQREDGNPNAKDVGTPPPTHGDQLKASAMKINTSVGTITVQLDAAKAPCTVASFAYLAGKKYFDGTTCHRLVTDGIFVLQCGDPSGTGSGGPGYSFTDENLDATSGTYPEGTVAMANAGPNTNGSQFFLVYQDSRLSPNYTPFGKVTAGLDQVKKVAAAGTSERAADGHPKTPVVIQSLTVS